MLFLGAGASKPFGIPTMEGFTDEILSILEKKNPEYNSMIKEIQADVAKLGLKPDIEAILTVLRGRIEPGKALKDVGPLAAMFATDYRKPDSDSNASVVVKEIEDAIYQRCLQIDRNEAVRMYDALWNGLRGINWGGNSFINRSPQKFFTTNYDLSIEAFFRRKSLSYDDGFQQDSFGNMAFVSHWGGRGSAISLYKMHGSIDYYIMEDGKIVRSDAPLETTNIHGERIIGRRMIYPAGEKYATRWPFFNYLSELRQALSSESDCLAIGYSFRDVPVNNAFVDAVQMNPGLRIFLVSPSASQIRDGMDESLKRHVCSMDKQFVGDPQPLAMQIIEQVRMWRIPS